MCNLRLRCCLLCVGHEFACICEKEKETYRDRAISLTYHCFKRITNFYISISSLLQWRRHWHPTPVFLPGKSHGWRSLVGCSPCGWKSRTRLSDFSFTFHFHALERDMATHSSVLAWRNPGTGKPGGLPSMGSYRVENN